MQIQDWIQDRLAQDSTLQTRHVSSESALTRKRMRNIIIFSPPVCGAGALFGYACARWGKAHDKPSCVGLFVIGRRSVVERGLAAEDMCMYRCLFDMLVWQITSHVIG